MSVSHLHNGTAAIKFHEKDVILCNALLQLDNTVIQRVVVLQGEVGLDLLLIVYFQVLVIGFGVLLMILR